MAHEVRWIDGDSVEVYSQVFATEQEALNAATSVRGVAMVTPLGVGTPRVFRDGRELHDAEYTDASLKFGHHLEVGISRPEEPARNLDPGDTTGSGWRAGTPAAWGWRVWKGKDGPTDWVGTYPSRAAARAAAERAQKDDSDLADLPIVDIGPADPQPPTARHVSR